MTLAFLVHNSEIDHLLATWGYAVVFAFVMIESLGIPFPGETTLTLAAIYAGNTHKLTLAGVIVAAALGAIVGDNIGYGIGRYGGYRLLRRYGRYVRIDEHRIKLGRYLFARHGGKVVFFGRFVSVLRTYAAFLAGTMQMHWLWFLVCNAAGGIVWATIFGVLFYEFGSALEKLQTPVDIALGVAALGVVALGIWYARRKEAELGRLAEEAFPDEAG